MQPQYELNELLWVSCPNRVWRPGRVASVSQTEVSVELEPVDEEEEDELRVLEVEIGGNAKGQRKLLRRNSVLVGDGALRYDNLTEVPELHEAAVLHALNVRFLKGTIYTLTGPVLLAVNPFRTLQGLYGHDVLRSFARPRPALQGSERRPHVFGTAARALEGIRERYESQTVLISGESGAGKTETTKFVMQFLALASAQKTEARKASKDASRRPGMSRVERQVLGSNPLLEAFGNAKTLRNDNSSRFGKYIELQFAKPEQLGDDVPNPHLVGARIRTYLLEKVRVISQQEGERNFHVFYQALASGSSGFRAGPELHGFQGFSANDFAYLRGSRVTDVEEEQFEATLAAMYAVGLSAEEVSDIFRVLSAVLHLGNISFHPPDGESCRVLETAESPADLTCELLGIKKSQLEPALTSRTRQVPGEQKIRSPHGADKAIGCRDALARHLYYGIFSYVVQRSNVSIGYQEGLSFCGVLDIFGFEFFDVNSLEQLCINYTNELLQQSVSKQ